MKIAIIGAGHVGTTLGRQLQQRGHTIKYGVRDPQARKTALMLSWNPDATAAKVADATKWGEAIIMCTPGPHDDQGIKDLAKDLGAGAGGKVVIDAMNPLTAGQGEDKLQVRWELGTSAAEVLQAALPPEARVFKAFNSTGVEHMSHPDGLLISGDRLTMLFAGDAKEKEGDAAVEIARRIVADAGFEPIYAGPLRFARNLEAMAELWIHMGWQSPDVQKRLFHFQVLRRREPGTLGGSTTPSVEKVQHTVGATGAETAAAAKKVVRTDVEVVADQS